MKLTLFFFSSFYIFFFCSNNLFMQDPNSSQPRTTKPWYQRAIDMATLWRSIISNKSSSDENNKKHANSWKTSMSKSASSELRKCTSLKVATSFTRVCLCAPISSYNEINPPRRSNSYPRSKPNNNDHQIVRTHSARHSTQVRRVFFRGKSLNDDVLMRRFVVEEEAVRRRNQMEVIRKRNIIRRKKRLGPSPLCRMVMANQEPLSHL